MVEYAQHLPQEFTCCLETARSLSTDFGNTDVAYHVAAVIGSGEHPVLGMPILEGWTVTPQYDSSVVATFVNGWRTR